MGQGSVPLALQGRKVVAQSLASIAAIAWRLAPISPRGSRGDQLTPRSRRSAAATPSAAELARRLESLHVEAALRDEADTLEGRLETIGSLIRADTPLRVFYTSHAGFDTHAGQLYAHQQLLQTLGKAVAGFLERLSSRELAERVRGADLLGVWPPAPRERQRRHRSRHGRAGADRRLADQGGPPGHCSQPGRSRRDRRPSIHRRFPRRLCVAPPPVAGRGSGADPGAAERESASLVNANLARGKDGDQQNGLRAWRIEAALVKRSLGSRARHFSMTAASAGGTSGRRLRSGTGCSSRSMRIRSPPPAGSS